MAACGRCPEPVEEGRDPAILVLILINRATHASPLQKTFWSTLLSNDKFKKFTLGGFFIECENLVATSQTSSLGNKQPHVWTKV